MSSSLIDTPLMLVIKKPATGRNPRTVTYPADTFTERVSEPQYSPVVDIRHMLDALDPSSGKMIYRIRERKRAGDYLSFLRILRARWPGEKLYLIWDTFSPPKTRTWLRGRPATTSSWCSCRPIRPG